MTIDQKVYLAIGGYSGLAITIMLILLLVKGIELHKKRKHLNYKMLLHYQKEFNLLVEVLNTYSINNEDMTYELYKDCLEHILCAKDEIIYQLSLCFTKDIEYIGHRKVSKQLIEFSHKISLEYYDWVHDVESITNEHVFKEKWDAYLMRYNKMRLMALDIRQLFSNEINGGNNDI